MKKIYELRDEKTGEVIANFVPKSHKPLQYEDLTSEWKRRDRTYDLKFDVEFLKLIDKGKVIEEFKDIPYPNPYPISFRRPLRLFALISGGFLPISYITEEQILVDRNFVQTLESIKKGSTQPDVLDAQWWLEQIKNDQLFFNPMTYAFEGNVRKKPTLEEFKAEYERAFKAITDYFPNATVQNFADTDFPVIYKILCDVVAIDDRQAQFLVNIAPLIAQSEKAEKLRGIEDQILAEATALGLSPKAHLSVLLAISCLYDDGRKSGIPVANAIIKPKPVYTMENAYNALSDLSAMRFHMSTIALTNLKVFKQFAFFTHDQALTLLWCGFEFSNIQFIDGVGVNFTLELTENLFPRLSSAERIELSKRL